MKKQKINIIVIISIIIFSLIMISTKIEIVNATIPISASNFNSLTANEAFYRLHPSNDATYPSAKMISFKPTYSGYIYEVQASMCKDDNTVLGKIKCAIYQPNTQAYNSIPSSTILATSNNAINSIDINIKAGITDCSNNTLVTFYFTGENRILLSTSTYYDLVFYVSEQTAMDNFERIFVARSTDIVSGYYSQYTSSGWSGTVANQDFGYSIIGQLTPDMDATPTPTPYISPTPMTDNVSSILGGISEFLFGDGTGLSAGFGLIVLLGITFLCFFFAGKSLWVLIIGVNIGFIVNVMVNLWDMWAIIVLIILDVAIIIRQSGILTPNE